MAATLAAAVEDVNRLALRRGAEPPLALQALLDTAAAEPLGPDSLWLSAMLLSTLIPTAFNIVFLLTAAIARLVPRSWRLAWAADLARSPVKRRDHRMAWKLTFFNVPSGLLAFSGVAVGLGWLLTWLGDPLAVAAVRWGIAVVDAAL